MMHHPVCTHSQVFHLDWIEDVGAKIAGCAIDLGSPENLAASEVAARDTNAAAWPKRR